MIRIVTVLVLATLAIITSCSNKQVRNWDKKIISSSATSVLSIVK